MINWRYICSVFEAADDRKDGNIQHGPPSKPSDNSSNISLLIASNVSPDTKSNIPSTAQSNNGDMPSNVSSRKQSSGETNIEM